ncbi:MAG: putative toluene tolerance transporter [Rhodospirillales bacterium]|nr:putative toluene tolerance transporter [Rhodospirillales bacterium]
MIRRSFLALAACFAIAIAAPAHAQSQDPAQFINELGQKALAALTNKSASATELQQRFRQLLNENFDVPTIARFALGRYWNAASPAQQQEYSKLFEDQIVDAYATRFREYAGEQFKVTTTRQEGNDTVVSSQIIRPAGGPPVDVDWRVRSNGHGPRIIDVAVAGVSMARTQQQEFAAVIERNGGNVDALIQALRSKTVAVAKPKG